MYSRPTGSRLLSVLHTLEVMQMREKEGECRVEICLSLSVFCPDHMLLIESPRASHTSEKTFHKTNCIYIYRHTMCKEILNQIISPTTISTVDFEFLYFFVSNCQFSSFRQSIELVLSHI